jgi:hypothetical protein
MEFSSFDPVTSRYYTVQIPPISIQVEPSENALKNIPAEAKKQGTGALTQSEVEAIGIEGNVLLESKDMNAKQVPFSLMIFVPSALFGFYLVQLILYYWLQKRSVPKPKTSRELILEALKMRSAPEVALPLIRQALLLRLYEVGQTKELIDHPQILSTIGLQGEIRRLLLSIDQGRFNGMSENLEVKEIFEEASQLYYRLRR